MGARPWPTARLRTLHARAPRQRGRQTARGERECAQGDTRAHRQIPDLYGSMAKTRQLMLPGNGEKPVSAPPTPVLASSARMWPKAAWRAAHSCGALPTSFCCLSDLTLLPWLSRSAAARLSLNTQHVHCSLTHGPEWEGASR